MAIEYAAPSGSHALSLNIGNIEVYGHDEQSHQTHIDIGREHQDQRKQGAGEERQQVDEEVLHRPAEAADALVDTRLELARRILVGIEIGHPEGQHLLDDTLRKVARHEDTHPLAEIVLGKGDQRREDFLAEEHDADDREDPRRLGPGEILGRHQCVDGIHRTVQHDGIDLRHQRPDEGQYQRQKHKPFVRFDKWLDVFEEVDQIHDLKRMLCKFVLYNTLLILFIKGQCATS